MIRLIPENEIVGLRISTYKYIIKSYKYELKPTKKHEVKSNQTLNTCRHLYNDTLSVRKNDWENHGLSVKYKDQQDYLPVMRNRKDETGKYLRDVYEQVEQDVIRRVDRSMANFYRRVKNGEKPGYPRFKSYNRYDSFTFPQYGNGCNIVNENGKKDPNGDYIRLSKIGDIKFIKHREIEGLEDGFSKIKTVTVKREINKLFVIFAVQQYVEIPNQEQCQYANIEELNNKSAGIDMGLINLVTSSTKQKIDPQKFLRKSEKRLAIEQRKLSKKQRYEKEIEIIDKDASKKQKKDIIIKKKIKVNSKNREKQRIKVAKVHKHITNQRRNFNHNISRILVDKFDLIVFEKLNIQKMMSNHHYAKSIADASWYQIQMFTKYKAEWAGNIVDFISAKNTTKECSKCGKINDIPIWKRTMVCSCGNIENRDVDASFVVRDRSEIYQQLKKNVQEKISRDAIARIQAFGDETSTQTEMSGRVLSMNQETSSSTKDGKLADTKLQAQSFRTW